MRFLKLCLSSPQDQTAALRKFQLLLGSFPSRNQDQSGQGTGPGCGMLSREVAEFTLDPHERLSKNQKGWLGKAGRGMFGESAVNT